MSKHTTAAAKIQERINKAIADNAGVVSASFSISDDSVQKEQRLSCSWEIRYLVDHLSCQRSLAGDEYQNGSLWHQFRQINGRISAASLAVGKKDYLVSPVSSTTKAGPAVRDEQKACFVVKNGREFMAALKYSLGKTKIKKVSTLVASFQAEQKIILQAMRKQNADYLGARKNAKAVERQADAAAISSGEFWLASKEAVNAYFHPPFEKNHLADVSAEWRAALFIECESTAWKAGRGDWRHKLVGTGRAYLCGIDDNGDEWGHRVAIELKEDQHGNKSLDASVEDAMAELFDVEASRLYQCYRQGDLIFRPCVILKQPKALCRRCGEDKNSHLKTEYGLACYSDPGCYSGSYEEKTIAPPTLESESEWTVRESHTIKSPSLRHNGRYFSADDEITVDHTSHRPVVLPAGEYCLHTINIADAD